MPALVAFCWLGLAPAVSHALSVDPIDSDVAGLETAGPPPTATTPGALPPRGVLSLSEEIKRPSSRLLSLAIEPGRGRRLSIRLFSAGRAATLAGGATPSIAGLTGDGAARPGGALSQLLAPSAPAGREAALYRLDYTGGPLQLKGQLIDVGARFSLSPGVGDQPSAEEAQLIWQAAGGRGLNLGGAWKLAPGISLASSHDTLRRDDILSQQNGLTTADTSHALTMALGQSSVLKASLTQHKEEWDRWLGRPGKQRQEKQVEFTSGFGPKGAGGMRLAMTSVGSAEGQNRTQESTREAHLNFAPLARLRLSADHVAKASGQGNTETTQTVGAALKLAREAELTATMKALSPGAGERKREMALSLVAKVAGGEIAAEQKAARGASGIMTSRAFSFADGLGNGAGRTNLKLDFRESRGDQPDAELARNGLIHLDRQLLPWLKMVAERRESAKGTTATPEVSAETKYEAVARLGAKTELSAGFVTGDNAGVQQAQRRLALSHELKGLRGERRLRVSVESGSWQEGADRRSVLRSALDFPTGPLPDWAKTLSSAHQFEDAQQYLLGRKPEWCATDMQFAGYRLWRTRRAGGPDGVDSLGFVHRRIVADRYHVQLSFEQRPEGTEGDQKGRPLPLRRQVVEVGGRAFAGVNVRCGLGLQTGLNSAENRVERVKLGLWGKLRRGDQVEGEVWRESGRWDDAAVDRTSVTMLYSRRVSDEDRVELKVGYTWGEGCSGDRDRDCRFALAYDKPV